MIKNTVLLKLCCILAFITLFPVFAQRDPLVDRDAELLLPIYRELRDSLTEAYGSPEYHKFLLEHNRKIGKLQDRIPNNTKFFCDVNGPGRRSKTPPTSVHKLRPGDIDIVATVGDSILGGNAVLLRDLGGLLVENRGLSFTSGGDGNWKEFFTLANILREYNPNLYGYSLGNGPTYYKNAKFNIAEAAAMSKDMKFQARLLYKRMKADPKVDIQKHWKVITIFMGHNDFCSENCYVGNYSQIIKNHRRDILKTLRYIRDNMPRTLVNYMPLANVTETVNFKGSPESCDIMHTFECSCMFRPEFKGHIKKGYIELLKKWIETDYQVVNRAEFHNKEDFEVVIQPFASYAKLPLEKNGLTDFRYLAFDCFHFSQRGHAAAANMLWNNMLQPEGKKDKFWRTEFTHVECPTEQMPYFATTKNTRK